jgi:diguanylate cyclase
MLVRTSLASKGQAPDLDRLLDRVRSDLRKSKVDVDSWRELQTQIDRQVALLDDAPTRKVANHFEEVVLDLKPVAATTVVVDSPTKVPDAENQIQRLSIARRVGHLLGHLLSQVSLEPDAETKARNLQRSLLSSDNWDELREGLNQVADLIVIAVNRSQKEFEDFLQRLNERLQLLQDHFSVQSSVHSGRQAAVEALDRNIRGEIKLASQSIDASGDLQGLKQLVGRHLELIGQSVGKFRVEETERETLLSEELAAMHEKVVVMEAHSEEMQEQVRKERQRAKTDLLTQLPNREAWQERFSFEFNRWKRYHHPLTVGVMDIDFFKQVNDSYGHKAGDRVLQLIAKEIKSRLRNTDFAARFGGEEFTLLFPETRPDDALVAMDKLRAHISALPFHFEGNRVTITFSAGLAAFAPDDTEETVFERADRALYSAKDGGRNCVKVS